MSLFIAILIFLVVTSGKARHYQQRIYNEEMYPVNVDLVNGLSQTKFSFVVPKQVAQYVKNLMDCLPQANAMNRLEDMADRRLSVKTSQAWDDIIHELERTAGQMEPMLDSDDGYRKWNIRPLVEIGPGAYKSDIVNYPPDTLSLNLKKLMALKKKQQAQNKDLNAGNENNV